MDTVLIRKANRDDCKGIIGLIQELADFQRMSDGPKIDHNVLEKDGFDAKYPAFVCYVAVVNKTIVGYTVAYYTYSTWLGKAMYLEDLYVTPNYRGKRFGSKLLEAMAKEAVEHNCCRLDFSVLKWNPAVEFYKRKGAVDLTTEEGWHHFRFPEESLKMMAAHV